MRKDGSVNLTCPMARSFGDEPALQPGTADESPNPLVSPGFAPVPGAWWGLGFHATAVCSDQARVSPGASRGKPTGHIRVNSGLFPCSEPEWERATLGMHDLVPNRAAFLDPARFVNAQLTHGRGE